MTTNPLLLRLTRHTPGPSLPACLLIAALTFALGAALIAALFLVTAFYPALIPARAIQFALIVLALNTALQAIHLTLRDVALPDQDLLRLTPLTPAHRLRGYALGTLYRLRLTLAVAAGLTGPLTALLIAHSLPDLGAAQTTRLALLDRCAGDLFCLFLQDHFTRIDPISPSLTFLTSGLGLLGLHLTGAALGVRLAMASRSRLLSGGLTLIGVVALSAAPLWAVAWADPHILDIGLYWDVRRGVAIAIMLVPWLVGAGLLAIPPRRAIPDPAIAVHLSRP